MRKIQLLMLILAVAVMNAVATPAKVFVTGPQIVDYILYECDYSAKEAILLENYDDIEEEVYPYTQTNFVVPSTITLTGVSASMGGDPSTSKLTLPVVELGERALKDANASSVTFATPSNIRAIRTNAFMNMKNMTGKLTLPASLEHLAISSILLPNITEIEFLGTTPPECDTDDGNKSAYNPWTASVTNLTPSNIKVTVPVGSEDLYKSAVGIGDYFDCFKNSGSGTGIAETVATGSHARKVIMNGQMYILRDGRLYNALGAQVN